MDKITKRGAFLINLLYFAAVVAIVVLVLRFAVPWLMPFIIGFIVAMIFHPLIVWTAKKLRAPRKFIACAIVVIGYAVLITGLVFGVIELVTRLGNFVGNLPEIFNVQIMPTISRVGDFIESFYDELPADWVSVLRSMSSSIVETITGFIGSFSSSAAGFLADFIRGVPGFLVSLVFTVLATFFVTMNYDQTKNFLMAQLNDRGREIVRAIKTTIKDTVFSYFRAYFKLMCVTFVELSIGLTVLGVSNSVGIAFGIAIFDILPVFGVGGILLPWTVISFMAGDIFRGVGLLIMYGIITVVRNFIEPKVVGDQLGLNPVVSIIAIYLGFRWLGVPGMILMPISVQIANTLHQKGMITLYKEPPSGNENSAETGENASTEAENPPQNDETE